MEERNDTCGPCGRGLRGLRVHNPECRTYLYCSCVQNVKLCTGQTNVFNAENVISYFNPKHKVYVCAMQGRVIILEDDCVYLDVSAELRGETLLFHVFDSSFAPEQVDGHTGGEEPLVLLPLQRLGEDNRTNQRTPRRARRCRASLTCPSRAMRREGGTTLTSPANACAMAARRFSLLLPSGYAWWAEPNTRQQSVSFCRSRFIISHLLSCWGISNVFISFHFVSCPHCTCIVFLLLSFTVIFCSVFLYFFFILCHSICIVFICYYCCV